jgi:ABC-2 type transport system permease protein
LTSRATVQPERAPARLLARRLWALALRHIYLHLGSWPRIVEMMYWPLVNIITWGFTSVYLSQTFAHVEVLSASLISAVVLMEFFMRPTMMALTLFMEELWSRNLGHLFASPLSAGEYVLGLVLVTLGRATIALTPLLLVAHYMFGFSLGALGWAAAAFIPLLALSGCVYGVMIVALIMRLGLSAEWLAWMATWLLAPFFAPYYPLSVLPPVFQWVALTLPPTYVFASMKSLIGEGQLHPENLLIALGLTAGYALVATFLFWKAYQSAQKRGGLLQSGE